MQGYGEATYDTLEKEMQKIINQYQKQSYVAVQKALEETADELLVILRQSSPMSTSGTQPAFRDMWAQKKYANAKYVYNSKLAKNGPPISNLIEYSARHTPFIQRTFEAHKETLFQKFKQRIEKLL